LKSGKINPPLLPSPPAQDCVSMIFSITFTSPTLERKTVPPFFFMYFSIDMLVSRLKTKFLHPSSSAFATPRPRVASLLSFFPFLTTTADQHPKQMQILYPHL